MKILKAGPKPRVMWAKFGSWWSGYLLYNKKKDAIRAINNTSQEDYCVCEADFERMAGFFLESDDPPEKVIISIKRAKEVGA